MTVRAFLSSIVGEHREDLVVLTLWSVAQLAPVAVTGWLLAVATDRGFLAGRPVTGTFALLAVAAALVAGAVCERQALPRVATIVEAVRDQLTIRVVTGALGCAVYEGVGSSVAGDVAKVVQQVEATRQILAALLLSMRGVVISVVGALIGLLALEPVIAALTVPPLAISAALVVLLSRVMARRCLNLLDAQEDLATRSATILGGLRDVAACGADRTATDTLDQAVTRQRQASASMGRSGAGRIGIVLVGARLPLVAVLLSAPLLADDVTAGSLVAVLYYYLHGLEPALQAITAAVGNIGAQLTVTMRNLLAVTAPEIPANASSVVPNSTLQLNQVTFGYNNTTPILKGIDLVIPAGAHIALVGPSGVGKSTLLSLLAGLDCPAAGHVSIGGVPLTHVPDDRLRSTIALLPQDGYLFAGSLRENLAYMAPSATDDSILITAAKFGLQPAVDRIGSLDRQIDPSLDLSAGERQLTTLVRAYLSSAEIVLLDEATCHLDPATEARAEQLFAQRSGTLIVVAHRISAALRAKQVIVIDKNEVTIGEHSSLIAKNRCYAELVTHWMPLE